MRFGLFFLAGSPSEDHVRDYGEILEQICSAAREFTHPEPQADDLTVVVLKVL